MNFSTIDEHVLNSLLSGFLISSLPLKEQLIPRQWLHRLHSVPANCESFWAQEKMSEYLQNLQKRDALLRSLLIGLLKPPLPAIFSEPPPFGNLPELPEDVVSTLESPSTRWAANLLETDLKDEAVQASTYKLSTPSEFFSKQPTPSNGAFCYAAVFSELPSVSLLNN